MRSSIHLIVLFTLLTQLIGRCWAETCPETFSRPPELISERNMDYLLEKHHNKPGVRVERIDISTNSNWTLPDSSDEAAIFFAIVGIVIIVAWIPYAFQYLEDLSQEESQYCPWYRLSLRHKSYRSTSGEFIESYRDASFTGIRLGIGSLSSKYSTLGLSFELGGHSIKDQADGIWNKFTGTYLIFGPSLIIGKPLGGSASFDLLGGFSTNPDVSLIGEASFNLDVPLSQTAKKFLPMLNISIGANFLDIRGDQGIFQNNERYSLYLGLGAGVIF